MRAIILAAGRGSRMRDLTANNPKCLVKLGENFIFDYQLAALRANKITDIAVATGYMSEKLRPYELVEYHNSKWSQTNMVSSLLCAGEWLSENDCIVSYSDIFYDRTAISILINNTSDLAIAYDVNWLELWSKRFDNPLDDAESFILDEDNRLINIGERVDTLNKICGQYMGLLKFSQTGWKKVTDYLKKYNEDEIAKLDMTSLLSQLLKYNVLNIDTYPFNGIWGEVDSETDLKVYEELLDLNKLFYETSTS